MSFLSGNILWNLLWIIPLILVLAIAGGVRRTGLLRKMFGTDERIARFSNASSGKRVFRVILLTLVVLLLAVALIVVFIIRSKIRTKRSGRGCGCGCAGCSGCSACASGKSDRRKSAE